MGQRGQRGTEGAVWDRGGSVGQRAQRGAEACAPGDPGSGRATVPTRSACRYSLWGRKEVERAGRSMERCAGLWMRRRPWLLVFSAASLRSVPVLSWLAVLICELWSFLRALQIKSGMVYDSRWIGWDKLRTYLGVKGHSRAALLYCLSGGVSPHGCLLSSGAEARC